MRETILANSPYKPTPEDLDYLARAAVLIKMYDLDIKVLDRRLETESLPGGYRRQYKYVSRPFHLMVGPIITKKRRYRVKTRGGYHTWKETEVRRHLKTLAFKSGFGAYNKVRKLANLTVEDND